MRRKRRSGCLPALLAVLCIGLGVGCVAAGLVKETGLSTDFVRETAQKVMRLNIPFQEVTATEEELEGKFYYSQLSAEEKLVYKEILDGLRENADKIYLHSGDSGRVNAIYQNVLNDHPEIFWCDGTGVSTAHSPGLGTEAYTVLEAGYGHDSSEKEQMIEEIENAANQCIGQIPEGASEYDKIKFVYEYLIDTVDYQEDAPDDQNIYSALVNHASVCAGYARSTQYLLEKLGISCIYVTGTATDAEGNTENHAWNVVRCGGNYYFVDTTWGDPVFAQDMEEGAQAEGTQYQRAMTYDYLCCSGRELFRTHTLDEGYVYPECVQEDLNYYRMNGMYYESFDRERVLDEMYRSIDAGEEVVIFKFADEEVYAQAHDVIVEELVRDAAAHLGRRYGLSTVRYSYGEEQTLCKITIYWTYN